MHHVFLGIGTNIGDRAANLRAALAELALTLRISGVSSVYQTEPVGFRDQPDFWNIVVSARTDLTSDDLLARVLDIETRLGRERSFRNAPRLIDIDLLLFDDIVLDTPTLEIPHPRMSARAFVLVPLLELAPAIRDPRSGTSYAEHLARVGRAGVELVSPPPELIDPPLQKPT